MSRSAAEMCSRTSVLTLIKTDQPSLNEKISAIHSLDEKLSAWWNKLPATFRLTPESVSSIAKDILPKVFLMNIVYHQSLCALHASIVPLFCWSNCDTSWCFSRQMSAQRAFEHAGAASRLFQTVLSFYGRLSAMPSFIGYAAYCGCAVQIPFLWCINHKVREKARENVRTNVKMLHVMANYWKFAGILVCTLKG